MWSDLIASVNCDDFGKIQDGDDLRRDLYQQSPSEKVHIAGLTLVSLAGKDTSGNQRLMTGHDRAQFDDCFATGAGHPAFRKHHVHALQAALESGNFKMATALLEKDETHQFLTSETSMIQHAIARENTWACRYNRESEELPDIVRLLISYGAQTNAADKDGNTPLYYACTGGCARSFQVLIAAGADFRTMHDALPNADLEKEAPANAASGNEIPKVNLLDIVLESHLERRTGCPIYSIWTDFRHTDWGYMVIFLLRRGLSFCRDDSRLVKFFHIACYQGNMPHVRKLLVAGIAQKGRPARSDEGDKVFGSALHAAVRGGQSAVVKRLLDRGAVAHAPQLCSDGIQSPFIPMTPVARACQWDTLKMPPGRTAIDLLNACELLVEAGAGDDDCKILLEQSAKQGNVEMVKRLLDRGLRLLEIPLLDDIDMVRLFLAVGTEYNASELQRHAVEKARLDLIKLLVDKDGPALPMGHFGYVAFRVMRGNSQEYMSMLRYLITDYGLDVNATFPAYPNATYHVNLLQRACEEFKPNAVRLLLEEGADPQCPGLHESALVYYKRLRSHGSNVATFAEKSLPIIRLLLQYARDGEVFSIPAVQNEQRHSSTSQPSDLPSMSFRDDSKLWRSGIGATAEFAAIEPHPWIEATAQAFRYEQLQGYNAIRLIELEPSESREDPIRCKVVHHHLAAKPDYEVLSCEWESSSETVPISLNGKTHEAPLALWSALRRVRLDGKPRLLWNDAICINSDDTKERNQQVALLRDLIKTASQLLVWLGEAADSSHLVFDHLKSCVAKNQLNWTHYSCETREAFLQICRRPWFFRTRSAQELALSKDKAITMCGQDEYFIDRFMKCTSFSYAGNIYHPLRGVDGPSYLHHLLDLKDYSPIINALLYTSFCTANEPREKVFAVATLLEKLDFPVDYGADVVDVFRTFTQNVIETTQDIKILHWTGTRGRIDCLPSWVPDFSAPLSSARLPWVFGSASYRMSYPSKVSRGIQFRTDGALVIQGKFIEKIQLVAEELRIDNSVIPGSKEFATVLHGWELLATQLVSRKRFPQAISDAFSDTLTAYDAKERVNEKRPLFGPCVADFISWYQQYGTGVLAKADEAFFEEIRMIEAWIHEMEGSSSYTRKDWSYYAGNVELVCYGRRFFITDQGSMGLAPAWAREDDHLVFFPGGLYPFAVRRRDDGTYELVGNCYLYDLDVFGLFEDPGVDTQEFVLL